MTHITIVRHATTEWMEQGRMHGISDSPLSVRGRREARQAALWLHSRPPFDAFYVSPLGRARETARFISDEIGLPAVVLDDLREADFGWMEGRITGSFEGKPLTVWHRIARVVWFPLYLVSGESWRQVHLRAKDALRTIVERHPDGHVLAVSHTITHSALVDTVLGRKAGRLWHMYRLAPCGITEIEWDGTSGKLVAMNQTAHLKPAQETAASSAIQ